ncbi:unnamed protein product [Amaranthus hypochondriacus]
MALLEIDILKTLVSSFFVVILILITNWLWVIPKRQEKFLRQQGIPGTSYNFLFGDMKEHFSMRSSALQKPMNSFTHEYFQRIEPFGYQNSVRFGKVFFVWVGPMPVISIAKPELIKEAFTNMHDFQKAKFSPIFDKLFPGLVSYEGEKWAQHRKIINRVFHTEKLKLMLSAFCDSCAEMINKWEMTVAETESGELDVWPDIKKLTADVISRAAFGSSYKDGQKIFELLKEQTELVNNMIHSIAIPGYRFLPTPKNRRFKKLEDRINSLLRALINKRNEEIEAGEEVKPDLLGILMDSNLNEIRQAVGKNKDRPVGMSLEEVIEECKLFYLAGHETTSTLLVWTLILLSKHQDWQARAREEIIQTFGDNVPDFEGLRHLKIVTIILYEVLRLYPPVIQMARRIYKDTDLGEVSLPSGSLIFFPVILVHRDKELWGDDAHKFKPERFSEGISKATKGNSSFFPFGMGPRICIGERFSMTEAKIALSMILQQFWFELSTSYTHAPINVLFLQPQYGAPIILHKR